MSYLLISSLVLIAFLSFVKSFGGQRTICQHANDSTFFHNSCDWSSDLAFSNKSALCKKFVKVKNYSAILKNRNFYLLGNSVIRHYSFNIKYLLEENVGVKSLKLNREEEKLKCGNVLDVNSCTQFLNYDSTFIKFMWMNTIGMEPDSTDKRDICSIANTTTEKCLRSVFENATTKDVLILSSSMVNSTNYEGTPLTWINYFTNIIASQMTYEKGPVSAQKTLDMLTAVFPGVIIWLPYPFITKFEGMSDESIEKVEKVNNFIRASIETYCSDRLSFLNTFSLVRDNKHLYRDSVHHPGKLSDMVVLAIFSLLKPLK